MQRSVKAEKTAHYINIPSEILKEMDIHKGDLLDVCKENDYIKVSKIPVKDD